jgi:hypothetical protein
MIRHLTLAGSVIAALCMADTANAKDARKKPPEVAAPALPVQDCSAFYNDNAVHGFGWGSGPGTSVGFGTFEGALGRYPDNSFPNWYGQCVEWGHYSSTGSVPRLR